MKKVNTLLKNKNVKPENIISFPYDKLIDFPWGEKGFCYFVDAENGNDANSGLTLKHAKKTINAALDLLPSDLLGHEARIFVHPGTYTNIDSRPVMLVSSINGVVKFDWLGTWANPDDPEFVNNSTSNWLVNLLDGARVRNNNQIIISAVGVSGSQASCFSTAWSNNFTTSVVFESCNFGKAWDAQSSQYAYRWKFMQDNTSTTDCIITSARLKNIFIANPIELDCTNFRVFGFFVDSQQARIDAIHAYSREFSNGITRTGYWGGVISCGSNCQSVSFENVYYPSNAYHPDFSKPSQPWKFEGCRQVIGFQDGAKANWSVGNSLQYLQGVLPDANPPQIYLSPNAQPIISFNSTVVTLNDTSTSAHKITDTSTGVTNNYIGAGLKTVANHFQIPLQTSAQSDSNLQNKDVVFYLDESNNKLKVKLKYSNGTIKTGEISLL